MDEFKKVAVYVDENKINSYIQPQEARIEYFQELVDMYNGLNTGVPLQTNDLKGLLENPKEFVAERLIKDGTVNIGGLKLNFDKVFEIIEKPIGTDQLINKIINDNQVRELMMNQRNVSYFEIKNGDTVAINDNYLESITEQCTVYIQDKRQSEAYEILKILAKNINKLNGMKVSPHLRDTLWDEYLTIDNQTGNVSVNPYFAKQIR